MTEPTVPSKQDSFEENQSSDEWTVIGKRGSESDDSTNEKTEQSELKTFQQLQNSKEDDKNADDNESEKIDKQEDKNNETKHRDKSFVHKNKNIGYSKELRIMKFLVTCMLIAAFFISIGVFFGSLTRQRYFPEFNNKCAYDYYEKVVSFSEKIDKFYQITDYLINFNSTWIKIQNHVNGVSETMKDFLNFKTTFEDYSNKIKN